ncbi:hypothetical protein GCM10022223_22230 [Kineosporia mesophila]|uniref:Uncharacterized protein n=1 Tax=Kineosporia mesophila TaxID=566012 RepID=A0ABP6ZFC3_9ACTN|nr:hypothetical protein [Kineosporia mesophila]MCD5350311.1 hypothetical protein [Kineosporia mesophila]
MVGRVGLLSAAAVAAVVVAVAAVSSVNGRNAETQDTSAGSTVPTTPVLSATPAAVTTPEAATTAVATVTAVGPTSAGSSPWQSVLIRGRAPVPTMDEAVLHDLGTYAEQHGESLDSVIQRFRGQDKFAELVNEIEADPGSGYSQAAWRMSPTTDPWIRFTGRPDETLLRRIENELSMRVEVQWGAPLTGKALETVSQVIFGAVADYPGVAEAASFINPDSRIEVSYRLEPGAHVDASRLRKKALRAGAKAAPTGYVPVDVLIVEDPDLRSEAY